MARVLIAFCNGMLNCDGNNTFPIPVFFESFINGIKKYGNEVLVYQHRIFNRKFQSIPSNIQGQIKEFDPELCILFNNAFFDLTDIVSCPILIFGADSPIYYSNKYLLQEKGYIFYYALQAESNISFVKENYGAKSNKIIKITSFTEIRCADIPKKYNISFIGTKFVNIDVGNSLMQIVKSHGDKSTKKEVVRLIETVRNRPLITDEELRGLFPALNLVDYGVTAAGLVVLISCERRIQVLSAVCDLGLEIFGKNDWVTDYYYDTNLMLKYNDMKVSSLDDNSRVYNSSKISISISHAQAVYAFPWRVMDIMASSSLLISDYHKGIEDCFPGINIPMYQDKFEARRLCQYYLSHDDERQEIIKECNRIIDSKYRLFHMLDHFSNQIGVNLLNHSTGNVKMYYLDKDSYKVTEIID